MIVEHRQRMAAAPAGREVPFEVHLPKPVRAMVLEAGEGPVRGTRLGIDQSVPMQDRRDRADARDVFMAQVPQPTGQLTGTPARVLASQFDHRGFYLAYRSVRRAQRPARAI